jgi:GTP-binding protein Era
MADEITTTAQALASAVNSRWELAAGEVAEALRQRLAVAFVGSASSGKDSAIRALFGIDFGQIDPIPGSTKEVRVAPIDPEGNVVLVNAPGFGDVRKEVDRKAREILDQIDIAVYVVNSDGGASIDERRDLAAIRAMGRPTLVCLNKIDLIRPHQREMFVEATLRQLGCDPKDAVVTAFDPMPALADAPIGVARVIRWITTHLEQNGKALLFAKNLRNKSDACEALVFSAAKKAALAGAIPLPGADVTALTAIQVKLISDIAAVFGRRMDRDLILFVLGEALAGTSKGFIKWGLEAAKAAGWLPGGQVVTVATSALGASIAAATTYGVGKAAVAFMAGGGKLSGAELREVFDAEAERYRTVVRDDPNVIDAE